MDTFPNLAPLPQSCESKRFALYGYAWGTWDAVGYTAEVLELDGPQPVVIPGCFRQEVFKSCYSKIPTYWTVFIRGLSVPNPLNTEEGPFVLSENNIVNQAIARSSWGSQFKAWIAWSDGISTHVRFFDLQGELAVDIGPAHSVSVGYLGQPYSETPSGEITYYTGIGELGSTAPPYVSAAPFSEAAVIEISVAPAIQGAQGNRAVYLSDWKQTFWDGEGAIALAQRTFRVPPGARNVVAKKNVAGDEYWSEFVNLGGLDKGQIWLPDADRRSAVCPVYGYDALASPSNATGSHVAVWELMT